jgi:GAF domain-containing protein
MCPSPLLLTNEQKRLEDLKALQILNTPPEECFDHLVDMARHLFHVPIAYISFIDENRQWLKAVQGMPQLETARESSFCTHTIMHDQIMVVPDASQDVRFANIPFVTDWPFIRFYAGYPLHGLHGQRVGSFCILDRQPRTLNEKEKRTLRVLAAMADLEANMAIPYQ